MPEKLNTDDYFYPIKQTESFIEYQDRAERLEGTQSREERERSRRRAIAVSALNLSQEDIEKAGHKTPESTMFALIGRLDGFSNAQTELDYTRDRPDENTPIYKRELIEFNHALQDAFIANKDLGITSLHDTLNDAYIQANGTKGSKLFSDQVYGAIVGAAHEKIAKDIINLTSGFEVDNDRSVDVSDDLHGNDIYVRDLATSESFGIDIKSSHRNARNPKDIVPEVKTQELLDTASLSPTRLRYYSHMMRSKLLHAVSAAERNPTEYALR